MPKLEKTMLKDIKTSAPRTMQAFVTFMESQRTDPELWFSTLVANLPQGTVLTSEAKLSARRLDLRLRGGRVQGSLGTWLAVQTGPGAVHPNRGPYGRGGHARRTESGRAP
eukprot:COSAG01_NODE_42278_length_441_cov_7.511696_1_plen_110_part_01